MQANDNGPRGDALTETGKKANSLVETSHPQVFVHETSTTGPQREELYSAAEADPHQITQLEAHIARMKAENAATVGFDRETGQPVYATKPGQRDWNARQIAEYERQLPMLREAQQRAAAWRAANVPSTEAKLAAEWEQQQRTRRQAEALAEQAEAMTLARRIVRERGGVWPK